MAQQESPREDLLAEATALVERAELRIAAAAEPVVVGFRANGAASLFFGQNEAYHFDPASQLRRAYLDGRLYKADRGRIASLERRRTDAEVQLVRHDLDADESARFLARLQERIAQLRGALAAGRADWLRQVPENADVRGRVTNWLASLPEPIEIARSPHVGS